MYTNHKDDEKMCRNAEIRHLYEVNEEGGNLKKQKSRNWGKVFR